MEGLPRQVTIGMKQTHPDTVPCQAATRASVMLWTSLPLAGRSVLARLAPTAISTRSPGTRPRAAGRLVFLD